MGEGLSGFTEILVCFRLTKFGKLCSRYTDKEEDNAPKDGSMGYSTPKIVVFSIEDLEERLAKAKAEYIVV